MKIIAFLEINKLLSEIHNCNFLKLNMMEMKKRKT